MNTTTFIGVIDGLNTWEVRNEAGEVVGYNQSAVESDDILANPTNEGDI